MITNRKEALKRFAEIEPMFASFLSKPCTVTIAHHPPFEDIHVARVYLATQAQVTHKLNKRECEGKTYTPYVFIIEFVSGETLEFVLEDAQITQGINKIDISIGGINVRIEHVHTRKNN